MTDGMSFQIPIGLDSQCVECREDKSLFRLMANIEQSGEAGRCDAELPSELGWFHLSRTELFVEHDFDQGQPGHEHVRIAGTRVERFTARYRQSFIHPSSEDGKLPVSFRAFW